MTRTKLIAACLLASTSLLFGTAAMADSPEAGADSTFKGMEYRQVGPFRGGRVGAVAGVAQQPDTYYFGGAAGGVWKTTDGGVTWKPLWDKLPEASPSIGAIVVAPSNPNIVYVGTGEGNMRGNVATGNGVWKSEDAGKSWKFIGLKESRQIGRMAVSATDPNLVFVAANGHAFGPNSERGVFRSRDGGKTWEKVLFVNDQTGAIDVQISPTNPNIVWATSYQFVRKPWTFESGGPGSGLWKSEDGGTTWKKVTGNGLPAGDLGRIGVSPTSDPNRIYVLIEGGSGGLYRTDDAGATWKLINGDNDYKQRAWYYSNVFADPKDPNKVYVTNTGAYKSIDGGKTFKGMPTFHGDNHQIWINPLNTDRLVNGNDGGADISVNGGETWTASMNQPTAQFYHIAVDNRTPYYLYGAQQDNSTVVTASGNVRNGIGIASWYTAGGGESGYVVPDPKDPEVVIANGYGGSVTRFDHKTGQQYQIDPWPHEVMGWAPRDTLHRPQWTEPLVWSPNDPNVLYNANEVLWKTTDSGKSWTQISPDLTRNDKTKQDAAGGHLTHDVTGVEVYGTIFSIAESPVAKGHIWVGTDDGLIQMTKDGGAHWTNVTSKLFPEWCKVDMIDLDAKKAGTAYAAFDCHLQDDFKPYAFRTDDFGQSWVPINSGIAPEAYVHAVRADPAREGLLYAATENGLYSSFDNGAHWTPFQLNLPRTPVHDIVVHDGDLAVATHGRAFWILDDLSPIRQWSDSIKNEDLHLFAPRKATRIFYATRGDSTDRELGKNPPTGAIVYYWLKTGGEADGRVKFEVLDSSGKVLRTIVQKVKKESEGEGEEGGGRRGGGAAKLTSNAGLNRFVWDFRTDGPVAVPHAALWHASLAGPAVPPGNYTIRLTVDGKTQTQPLTIAPNPNLKVTQAQLEQQYALSREINAKLSIVQNSVLEIRALRKELGELKGNAKVAPAATALDAKVDAIQEVIEQRRSIANEDPLNYPVRLNNHIASLASNVAAGDTEPSKQEYEEWADLKAKADDILGKWQALKAGDLASFNATLQKNSLKPITLSANQEFAKELAMYGEASIQVGLEDD